MNPIKAIILPAIAITLAFCHNAGRNTGTTSQEGKTHEATIAVPPFNADSAYSFVKAQVNFGPRVNNTKAHEKCGDYLTGKLREYCSDVTIQSGKVKAFNGTVLNFKNIIASFNPYINNRIFLCSHWDSRPWADHDPDPAKHKTAVDGANDGASGVGILLEIARQLKIAKPAIGVDIILLDAEDYGPPEDQPRKETSEDFWGLGSQYWARTPHKANYFAKYGILLDMVGASNATFLQEGFSMQFASDVVRNVWTIASRLGYSEYFPFEKGGFIDDDHLYINRGLAIPTIDIIHLVRKAGSDDTGFYPGWHTTHDNMGSIDKTTLDAVGKVLMAVIEGESL